MLMVSPGAATAAEPTVAPTTAAATAAEANEEAAEAEAEADAEEAKEKEEEADRAWAPGDVLGETVTGAAGATGTVVSTAAVGAAVVMTATSPPVEANGEVPAAAAFADEDDGAETFTVMADAGAEFSSSFGERRERMRAVGVPDGLGFSS
jgi:hypothetical protein